MPGLSTRRFPQLVALPSYLITPHAPILDMFRV
jgi:hypothetical protein